MNKDSLFVSPRTTTTTAKHSRLNKEDVSLMALAKYLNNPPYHGSVSFVTHRKFTSKVSDIES